MYGFIHFGMNTMTDREWGDGHEDPGMFDPDDLDADEWMRALASAGMRGVILTAKHHDGFCLWPTASTAHSVASSPWSARRRRESEGADERPRADGRESEGAASNPEPDLVREVADAARRHGLAFGVYLSPWDRTDPRYGSGIPYDDAYVAQLTELLTGYGPIFSVWLDGANGEGPDGRVQQYDWDRYYAVIRALQPDAVISVCGPDARWCGNEAGDTRPDEWSVVPRALQSAERTAAASQQSDDADFAQRTIRSDERDLGSRAALAGVPADELVWYPAEVNTSIRPGWFHHPAEDGSVTSADELFELWMRSVGGNSTLLLNVPPTRAGRIAAPDRAALAGLGERIRDFTSRRIEGAVDARRHAGGGNAVPALALEFAHPASIEAVVLGEDITQGQRIERVMVRVRRRGDGEDDGDGDVGTWVTVAEAGAVGYRRIVRLVDADDVTAVRVELPEFRAEPVLRDFAVVRVGDAHRH
ncbi:alpha-L-fucosidase [Schumannella sp. 10F1B-5-1]|nr:alpha-L-fucosidase [Schumannella sp. 10F1B-5-1]